MPHQIHDLPLPHGRPGTTRTLRLHRFGREGAGPKTYIQAGLHAGELPGMLVAQHLVRRLSALDAAGEVAGEVLVVPAANPVGLDQVLHGSLLGRFELATGQNFNRAFAELSASVADGVRGQLGVDGAANMTLARAALREAVAGLPAITEADGLKRLLQSLSCDADLVLDLHCDSEAVMHLYTTPGQWAEGFADLGARLGCETAFLADDSGGDPFDEVHSGFWPRLRAALETEHPLPGNCAATTIELRGLADVDDAQAARDAEAILGHLAWRGVLSGPPPPTPTPLCDGTPLAGVDRVRATEAGVIAFHAPLGARVEPGQVVAEIVDPVTGARQPCRAQVAGPVWSRRLQRFASAGDIIMSIAGAEPLAVSGSLLTAR